MPCSDSSSSIFIRLDHDERFVSFEFAKITCGSEIKGGTGFSKYLAGKALDEILHLPLSTASRDLNLTDEESRFILHLEMDALKAAIVQYLGRDQEGVDNDRCQITSITHDDHGIEIAEIVLPPKDLPKIIACGLAGR